MWIKLAVTFSKKFYKEKLDQSIAALIVKGPMIDMYKLIK